MVRKKTLPVSCTPKTVKPKLKSLEGRGKLLKDGLSIDAYAIRADEFDTATWQLPHHTRDLGRKPIEQTVDFVLLDHATLLLSRWGDQGVRCHADPELIILAARHLAGHYRAAGRTIPVALCVLI